MATTITVDERTLERFNGAKAETKDDHTPEMSSDTFLNSLLDTREKVQEDGYGGDYPTDEITLDMDDLASEIADRVEDTGGVGPEQVAREVSRRLDYAQVANAVADEVEGRLR